MVPISKSNQISSRPKNRFVQYFRFHQKPYGRAVLGAENTCIKRIQLHYLLHSQYRIIIIGEKNLGGEWCGGSFFL